jgi:UBX domain-containing protein 1
VKLVNKIEEDYVPPSYVAFSGTAHSLGSTSSNEAFVFSTELLRGIPIPVLDESQPAVNIQLRTHDNKKIKLRVNANIVISSLAALILKETNSQSKSIRFTLSAGFPPKDVTDPTATVSEAGLAGAAVTMKAV